MMINTILLATGIAITISVASTSALACKIQIPSMPGYMHVSHPASVPVSAATRHAIDENRIADIPRDDKQAKLEALQQIERRFADLTQVAKLPPPHKPLAFSIFLTESGRWERFQWLGRHWTGDAQNLPQTSRETVIVVSDTALMNLMDRSLTLQEAQALGLLAISGSVDDQINATRIFEGFLQASET